MLKHAHKTVSRPKQTLQVSLNRNSLLRNFLEANDTFPFTTLKNFTWSSTFNLIMTPTADGEIVLVCSHCVPKDTVKGLSFERRDISHGNASHTHSRNPVGKSAPTHHSFTSVNTITGQIYT